MSDYHAVYFVSQCCANLSNKKSDVGHTGHIWPVGCRFHTYDL